MGRIFYLLSILFIVMFSGYLYSEPNLKEGLWEITTEMQVAGMPMKMPPQTTKICLTKKDYVPQKPEKEQNCKILMHEVRGNTVNWIMECIDRGEKITNE
ncbi:DUF3617 domain-containing protein [Thermodesulfovibrio hydrogeniphilus]